MTCFVWNLKLNVFMPSDYWKYFLDISAMILKGSYRESDIWTFFLTQKRHVVMCLIRWTLKHPTITQFVSSVVGWAMFTTQRRRGLAGRGGRGRWLVHQSLYFTLHTLRAVTPKILLFNIVCDKNCWLLSSIIFLVCLFHCFIFLRIY